MGEEPRQPLGDPVLAALYAAFVGAGGEIGVSLLVGGGWITGMLCSPRSWFEQVAFVVDEGTEGEMGLVFRMIGRSTYPTDDEVDAGVADPRPDDQNVGFLHLRDARAIGPTGSVPSDGRGLLRLRIEQVDGWMIGNLGEPGYSPPPPTV